MYIKLNLVLSFCLCTGDMVNPNDPNVIAQENWPNLNHVQDLRLVTRNKQYLRNTKLFSKKCVVHVVKSYPFTMNLIEQYCSLICLTARNFVSFSFLVIFLISSIVSPTGCKRRFKFRRTDRRSR